MSERVTHGTLPHWYKPGFAHFVTYRVAGSLPISVIRELKLERDRQLKRAPPEGMTLQEHRQQIHKRLFVQYDRCLGRFTADAPLADPQVVAMIQENLYHHHGSKYQLLAYCIMPTHVHLLIQPFESALAASQKDVEDVVGEECADGRSPLSHIMHSVKSYTATQANRLLHRTSRFWQHESYDHWVRDTVELERVVAYIAGNPVKAALCSAPQLWNGSSAFDRYHQDGSTCALVGWLRDDWKR